MNSGDSIENAIKIEGINDSEGTQLEYVYISKRFGIRDKDWKFVRQYLETDKDKYYDALVIALAEGKEQCVYFDITEIYGK